MTFSLSGQTRSVLLAICVFITGYFLGSLRLSVQTVGFVSHAGTLRVSPKIRTRVVMFVPTPIGAVQKRSFVYRQFLRERWSASDAIVFFVVGSKTGPRLEEDLNMTSIAEERARGIPIITTNCRDYGDEVNNANGTSSTTCKVYEAVKYAHAHYEAEYLFRGADDAYVNLKRFLQVADGMDPARKPWIMGQLRVPIDAHRSKDLLLSNQPNLHKLYGMYMFGQYMLGCGYVFTWDVAAHIATWVIPPHQTYAEDVIVGMWLNPFRIEKIDDEPNFTYLDAMRRYHEKAKNGILVHYVNTEEEWSSIDDEGTLHVSTGLENTFPLPPLEFFLAGNRFSFPVPVPPKKVVTVVPTLAPVPVVVILSNDTKEIPAQPREDSESTSLSNSTGYVTVADLPHIHNSSNSSSAFFHRRLRIH